MYIAPQNKAQNEEVIVYINDEAGRVSETMLFKIIVK